MKETLHTLVRSIFPVEQKEKISGTAREGISKMGTAPLRLLSKTKGTVMGNIHAPLKFKANLLLISLG